MQIIELFSISITLGERNNKEHKQAVNCFLSKERGSALANPVELDHHQVLVESERWPENKPALTTEFVYFQVDSSSSCCLLVCQCECVQEKEEAE